MKIASSTIQFSASHQHTRLESSRESLRLETTTRPATETNPVALAARRSPRPTDASDAPAGPPRAMPEPARAGGEGRVGKTEGSDRLEDNLDQKDLFRFRILSAFVEAVTGRKLELKAMKVPDEEAEAASAAADGKTTGDAPTRREDVDRPPPPDIILSFQRESWRMEREQVDFQAQGRVRTSDGREIEMDLSLSMSREVFEYSRTDIQASTAQLKDPLVINLDASSAALTSERMHFDIDADGTPERVARLAAGSGFLAVDRDGDGKVSDGSELFGAITGDGFAELARHDADSNGWIDEADPIWDRLQIWLHEGDEDGQLIGVGQAGVGAIFLGRVDTPFALHDQNGDRAGQMRHTGIYLNEDGSAGTMQKLDLVV